MTYNHVQYIEKTVASVLSQDLDVPIEICIGEDASTDGTRELCRKLAEEHPGMIRLYERSREDVIYIGGRPTGRSNFFKTIEACKGEFIAILDGDDYWVDPQKLKKQYEVFRQNPDCNLVFTRTKYLHEKTGDYTQVNPDPSTYPAGWYTLPQLIESWMVNTTSVMFRKSREPFPDWTMGVVSLDKAIVWLLTQGNPAFLVDDASSVYRVHGGGVSSGEHFKGERMVNSELELLHHISLTFNEKVEDAVRKRRSALFRSAALSTQLPAYKRIRYFALHLSKLDLSMATKLKHFGGFMKGMLQTTGR